MGSIVDKKSRVGVVTLSRNEYGLRYNKRLKKFNRNYRIQNCSVEGALWITSSGHYEFTEN